ncbi:MAG: hypothetical protein AAF716_22705 [Cyanobacteria bacterium P01_D01_bin.1]
MSSYTQPDQPSNQPVNQPSTRTSTDPESSSFSVALPLPIDIAIGLATLPMLAIVISSQLAAHALTQLGDSSEELFRGDRLPTLPLLKL